MASEHMTWHMGTCHDILQYVVTSCNILWHLEQLATFFGILEHVLQHVGTSWNMLWHLGLCHAIWEVGNISWHPGTCCDVLENVVTVMLWDMVAPWLRQWLSTGGLRAVNNTGKKYWQYQYQYFQIKVLAIPIPILKSIAIPIPILLPILFNKWSVTFIHMK